MGNVEDVVREKDILFRFRRINQKDNIILLGVDEYACSISLVRRARVGRFWFAQLHLCRWFVERIHGES
jgi:hypothetical protein